MIDHQEDPVMNLVRRLPAATVPPDSAARARARAHAALLDRTRRKERHRQQRPGAIAIDIGLSLVSAAYLLGAVVHAFTLIR